MAATCDDLVVRLVDIETRRIVREFAGFRGRVLDVVRAGNGLESLFVFHALMILCVSVIPNRLSLPTRAGW